VEATRVFDKDAWLSVESCIMQGLTLDQDAAPLRESVTNGRPRQKPTRAAGIVCLGVAAAIFAWNLIIANTLIDPTGYSQHPVLGKVKSAGVYLWGEEGFGRASINSLGLHGPEPAPPAAGEHRILALGDSFTEGMAVGDDGTFSAVLQQTLGRQGIRAIAINAGRGGGSPAEYLALADYWRTTMQPERVVVQITDSDLTSDMTDSSKQFYAAPDGTGWRLIRRDAPDDLSMVPSRFRPYAYAAMRVPIVRWAWQMRRTASPDDAAAASPKPATGVPGAQKGPLRQRGGSSAAASAAPRGAPPTRLASLVDWTVAELKKAYPGLVILHIPNVKYGSPEQSRPSESERLVERACARQGVPLVAVRQDYVAEYERSRRPSHGFFNTRPGTGHINTLGHRLIADRLAELFEEGWRE
jgi:lysophospholipase L1-like esterase